jgi:hypothetical protein
MALFVNGEPKIFHDHPRSAFLKKKIKISSPLVFCTRGPFDLCCRVVGGCMTNLLRKSLKSLRKKEQEDDEA